MDTLDSWNEEPVAENFVQAESAGWRWNPVYVPRILVALAGIVSCTMMLRVASIGNQMAADDGPEARLHLQEEIVRWISQRPSGTKASVVAVGTIHRDVFRQNAWVEAMIDDPSKPADARL